MAEPAKLLEEIMIDATTNAKQAGGVQFVNWALRLVQQSGISGSAAIELNYMANTYPGRSITDDQKWQIIGKMRKAGIEI